MPRAGRRPTALLRRLRDRIRRSNARAAAISARRAAVKRSAARGRHGPGVPGPFDQ